MKAEFSLTSVWNSDGDPFKKQVRNMQFKITHRGIPQITSDLIDPTDGTCVRCSLNELPNTEAHIQTGIQGWTPLSWILLGSSKNAMQVLNEQGDDWDEIEQPLLIGLELVSIAAEDDSTPDPPTGMMGNGGGDSMLVQDGYDNLPVQYDETESTMTFEPTSDDVPGQYNYELYVYYGGEYHNSLRVKVAYGLTFKVAPESYTVPEVSVMISSDHSSHDFCKHTKSTLGVDHCGRSDGSFKSIKVTAVKHPSSECQNSNNGAEDQTGDDCTVYDVFPSWCGEYDDDDFEADSMCCACFEGTYYYEAPEEQSDNLFSTLMTDENTSSTHEQTFNDDTTGGKYGLWDVQHVLCPETIPDDCNENQSGASSYTYGLYIVNPCREAHYVSNTSTGPLTKTSWKNNAPETFSISDFLQVQYGNSTLDSAFSGASGDCTNVISSLKLRDVHISNCDSNAGSTCLSSQNNNNWKIRNPNSENPEIKLDSTLTGAPEQGLYTAELTWELNPLKKYDDSGPLTTTFSPFKILVNKCMPTINLLDDSQTSLDQSVPITLQQGASSIELQIESSEDDYSEPGANVEVAWLTAISLTGSCPGYESVRYTLMYLKFRPPGGSAQNVNEEQGEIDGGLDYSVSPRPDDNPVIFGHRKLNSDTNFKETVIKFEPRTEDQVGTYEYELRYYPESDNTDHFQKVHKFTFKVESETAAGSDATTTTTTDQSAEEISNTAFNEAMDNLEQELGPLFMVVGQEPFEINLPEILGIQSMRVLRDTRLEITVEYDDELEDFVDFDIRSGKIEINPTSQENTGSFEFTIHIQNEYGSEGEVTVVLTVNEQGDNQSQEDQQSTTEEDDCDEEEKGEDDGKGGNDGGDEDEDEGKGKGTRRRLCALNPVPGEEGEGHEEEDDFDHFSAEEYEEYEEFLRDSEIGNHVSNALFHAFDDEDFDFDDIELEITVGGQDITLRPEELATQEGAITDIFNDPSISELPVEERQNVFDDLLSYNQKYLEGKSSFAGVTATPEAPAIAFNNVASNGAMTLALTESSAGLTFLKEMGSNLRAQGNIASELFNPAIFAQQNQLPGRRQRRLSSDRPALRSLADGDNFDLSNYISFEIYRGADNSAEAEALEFQVMSDSVEGDILSFNIEFTNPLMVSVGTIGDVLVARIEDASLLSSAESGSEVDPNFSMQKLLPRMLPGQEFAVALESTAAKVEAGMQVGLVVQLVICIVLAASLKAMWNFLNVVQVLVYLRFFAEWSGTMTFIFQQMDNAVTLKPLIAPIMELGQSKFAKVNNSVEDEGLKNSGVEDNNVLKNLGLFGLMLATIFLGIIGYFILKQLHKKGNKHVMMVKEKVEKKLFFSGIYRYLIVSNLKLTVTLFGFLLAKFSFETFATGAASAGLLLGIFGLLCWPLYICFFLEQHFDDLEENQFKKKHETIYQGIRTDSRQALVYYSVFSLRRFYLVVINVAWSSSTPGERSYNLLKVIFFIILQSIYLLYIFESRPHSSRTFNRLEFFNEGMLTLLAYVMLIFSGMTPISDLLADKLVYGFAEWLGVSMALFICVMNFYVMGKMTIDKMKAKMAEKKQTKLDALLALKAEKRAVKKDIKQIKELEEIKEEVQTISLSKRVEEMLKAAREINCELVRPDDGPGVKIWTTDRKTKVEATSEGYKITTKDRNIKVIPQEYVKLTSKNPALLISSLRQEVHYDKEGNIRSKQKSNDIAMIPNTTYLASDTHVNDIFREN